MNQGYASGLGANQRHPNVAIQPLEPEARRNIEQDRQLLPTALSRPASLVGRRAHGAFVEDVDGQVSLRSRASLPEHPRW